MRFLKLELENIFAYRRKSELDLSECTDERNIVVVQGRNGRGKTSLLNAAKLLFVGAEDERIRRVGFGASPLTPRQFVLGQQGRWYGVFNHAARASELPARVALYWEADGVECRAERIFLPIRGGTDYHESATVTLGHRRLESKEARQYLQGMLSREIVPFFFFDGEQIQSLADAEVGRERTEIERLLGLYFVAHITREIEAYGRERKKAGLPETVRAAIGAAEAHERAARLKAEAEERARVSLEEEIADQDAQKQKLEAERAGLRNGLSEAERKRLEDRIALIGEERAGLAYEIATQLPVEAPALANLGLTRRAFELLETQLQGGADSSVAAQLHRAAPEAVIMALSEFDPDLATDARRCEAVQLAVRRALRESGIDEGRRDNPLFASLSPRDLHKLRDRFLVWSETGQTIAATQVGLLRKARQLAHEEAQLTRELDESDITTDEARARYAELSEQIDALDQAIRENVGRKTVHAIEEEKARKDQAQHADAAQREYAKFDNVVKQNAAFQVSQKAKRALEFYREERRRMIRESVQSRLQEKAGILLGPSQLVKSVKLDEHFGMTYADEFGEPIGRYSLSAGMRQLAAMAMLWALKEETGRPLPVIIDTPLGRIDRENRNIILDQYFPNAGTPLVVLPTDSELTEGDLALLSDRIAKHYEIKNTDGVSAELEETSRTRRSAGGARG